jgi:hypothetical protein
VLFKGDPKMKSESHIFILLDADYTWIAGLNNIIAGRIISIPVEI